MKHKIILLSVCILAFFLVTACDTTEYNPGGLTAETVYTTPEGFESLVSAAYSYQRWWYGKDIGTSLSEMGTDLWTGTGGAYRTSLNMFISLTPALGGDYPSTWDRLYAAINLCNAGIEGVGESGLSESLQAIREAELRFLRAHYYWLIVETWGGVHLTTEETKDIEVTANRSSVDEFYTQIFEDLNFAIQNLPPSTPDWGRATRPAAEAFAARMHLTRGNDQDAYDLAKTVIDDYDFELVETPFELWDMENQQNEEVIYAVHYSENISDTDRSSAIYSGHPRGANNLHMFYTFRYQSNSPAMVVDSENQPTFNRFRPSYYAITLYHENDSRYDASFKDTWIANTPSETWDIAVGDTAIHFSRFDLPSEKVSGDGAPDHPLFLGIHDLYHKADSSWVDDEGNEQSVIGGRLINNRIYINLWKWHNMQIPATNTNPSWKDVPVLRLAEMYLIAAEAQFKLNSNGLAMGYINELRQRAAYPGTENTMIETNPAAIDMDYIMDERARELIGEHLRWFDLKRTGMLAERVELYAPHWRQNLQPHHELRPIPQHFLDSIDNFEEFGGQNPGYN